MGHWLGQTTAPRVVREAHELPDQLLIDALALHHLRVNVERQPRVGVPELGRDPAWVAPGGEGEAREGAAQGVRRDPVRSSILPSG